MSDARDEPGEEVDDVNAGMAGSRVRCVLAVCPLLVGVFVHVSSRSPVASHRSDVCGQWSVTGECGSVPVEVGLVGTLAGSKG